MKEKIKVFAQKCFCWVCMGIGFVVGHLLSYLIIRLCHLDTWIFDTWESVLSVEMPDSARVPFLINFSLCGAWFILLASWESFSSKIALHIEQPVKQKDFWLFGGKLLLQTVVFVILAILFMFIVQAVFMGLCLLATPLVDWLIQVEILSATHKTAIIVVSAVLIGLLFIGLIILIFRIINMIINDF